MLIIDGNEYKIEQEQVNVSLYTVQGIKGYALFIKVSFTYNDKNGYFNLDAGYEKSDDIRYFLNREYKGIPFQNIDQVSFFEIFDTEKFLDTEIESDVILTLSDLKDNKVFAKIELNDELIKLNYEGYLEVEKWK